MALREACLASLLFTLALLALCLSLLPPLESWLFVRTVELTAPALSPRNWRPHRSQGTPAAAPGISPVTGDVSTSVDLKLAAADVTGVRAPLLPAGKRRDGRRERAGRERERAGKARRERRQRREEERAQLLVRAEAGGAVGPAKLEATAQAASESLKVREHASEEVKRREELKRRDAALAARCERGDWDAPSECRRHLPCDLRQFDPGSQFNRRMLDRATAREWAKNNVDCPVCHLTRIATRPAKLLARE